MTTKKYFCNWHLFGISNKYLTPIWGFMKIDFQKWIASEISFFLLNYSWSIFLISFGKLIRILFTFSILFQRDLFFHSKVEYLWENTLCIYIFINIYTFLWMSWVSASFDTRICLIPVIISDCALLFYTLFTAISLNLISFKVVESSLLAIPNNATILPTNEKNSWWDSCIF